MTTTTTTTARPGGLTPLAKTLLASALVVSAGLATKHFAPGLFGGKAPTAEPTVPPRAQLPSAPSSVLPKAAVAMIAPPTSEQPGCPASAETRMLIWAWNAQQGLLFANGGKQATEGSLMCKQGVNLKLTRQDAVDQMQAELVKCASELASGHADCAAGAHFVAIMGDGARGVFRRRLNQTLAKVL